MSYDLFSNLVQTIADSSDPTTCEFARTWELEAAEALEVVSSALAESLAAARRELSHEDFQFMVFTPRAAAVTF